jgi:hypothetical protein
MKRTVIILLLLFITSCGTASDVIKLHNSENMVVAKDAWGEDHGGLELKAISKASEFCGERGLKIIDTEKTGAAGWTGTSVTIRFQCIAQN